MMGELASRNSIQTGADWLWEVLNWPEEGSLCWRRSRMPKALCRAERVRRGAELVITFIQGLRRSRISNVSMTLQSIGQEQVR